MTFETFIPPRAKTVLEITGNTPADFETSESKFLEIQPDCKYTITKDFADINDKFDSILIQSPIIGKLENDELIALIKNAADKLNPRGMLIFALDNVSFAENVMTILEDKPLKFKTTLTRVELESAIVDAGLNKLRSMRAARRVPIARGVAEAAKTDVAVFCHIITACAGEMPPRTMIQSVIGEKLVCAPMRIYTPNAFLLTEPNMFSSSTETNQSYRLFSAEHYDKRIFINQRRSFPTFTDAVKHFESMKSLGYLYIEEMDDHPVRWQESYEKTEYVNFLSVHAIQTSTEYLADYFKQFNPHVKVFANHLKRILPLRDFDNLPERPVTILFAALNRDEEFKDILPLINEIAEKYGEKIAFKIIANKEHYEAINSKNKTLIGDPRVYNGQYVSYEKYEETLRESDIALLPLLDNKFNRSKSDLKFIECAGNGAVVLASPVVYHQTVKDGENGFIFYSKQEFSEKLQILIDNADKRREMATAAYEYVKHNRLLSQHYEERMDWYNELFAKLPELNEEAQVRIDKIAPKFKDEKPAELPNRPLPVAGFSKPNAEIIIPDAPDLW